MIGKTLTLVVLEQGCSFHLQIRDVKELLVKVFDFTFQDLPVPVIAQVNGN